MSKLLRIFALGGNEISPTGVVDPKTGKLKNPDLPEQWDRASKTCELLASIIKSNPNDQYILTHGNGPQVGNILLRAEYALSILHTIPLDVCGADSQGGIGYMLAQLTNHMRVKGLDRMAAETIMQVVVDKDDPAFKDPTKFIGQALTEEEAQMKTSGHGWQVKVYKVGDDGKDVWRRVVPSPYPIDIVELDAVEANLKAGIVPIAVGGGGIPVVEVQPEIQGDKEIYKGRFGIEFIRSKSDSDTPAKIYSGVEAVIDKDLASALLGTKLLDRAKERGEELDAEFTIFTNIDGVKLNFQQPDQKDLTHMTVDEAQKLYDEGNFVAGSIGPKVKACIDFIKGGGKKAYITKVDLFDETIKGNAGTTIVP